LREKLRNYFIALVSKKMKKIALLLMLAGGMLAIFIFQSPKQFLSPKVPVSVPGASVDTAHAASALFAGKTQENPGAQSVRTVNLEGHSLPLHILLGLPFDVQNFGQTFSDFSNRAKQEPKAAMFASMLMGKCQDMSYSREADAIAQQVMLECRQLPFNDLAMQDTFKLSALRSKDYELVQYVSYHPPAVLNTELRSEIKSTLQQFADAGNIDAALRLSEMLVGGNVLERDNTQARQLCDGLLNRIRHDDKRFNKLQRLQTYLAQMPK
jgi:hypothetical protein